MRGGSSGARWAHRMLRARETQLRRNRDATETEPTRPKLSRTTSARQLKSMVSDRDQTSAKRVQVSGKLVDAVMSGAAY